jgi:hypothetical protein
MSVGAQNPGLGADLTLVFTKSWILLCSTSADDQASVHERVDRIFSNGFSFYPELEWKTRYPPPQGHEILGAWRDEQNRAFAFLLDNPGMKPPPATVPLLLHCAGTKTVLDVFLPGVETLKNELKEKSERQQSSKKIRGSLKQADASKLLRHLMGLIGPITGITNAFAVYLRKLPTPSIDVFWFARVYNFLLATVYCGSLFLLLVFVGLCVLYTIRMGYLLLRTVTP